jgi:hypothetical protein
MRIAIWALLGIAFAGWVSVATAASPTATPPPPPPPPPPSPAPLRHDAPPVDRRATATTIPELGHHGQPPGVKKHDDDGTIRRLFESFEGSHRDHGNKDTEEKAHSQGTDGHAHDGAGTDKDAKDTKDPDPPSTPANSADKH